MRETVETLRLLEQSAILLKLIRQFQADSDTVARQGNAAAHHMHALVVRSEAALSESAQCLRRAGAPWWEIR